MKIPEEVVQALFHLDLYMQDEKEDYKQMEESIRKEKHIWLAFCIIVNWIKQQEK